MSHELTDTEIPWLTDDSPELGYDEVEVEGARLVFAALGHRVRIDMVMFLSEVQDTTAGGLAEVLEMKLSNAMHHLAILERAGIVNRSQKNGPKAYELAPGVSPLLENVIAMATGTV
jgi:DNA-binding transcriptional ArsR family regulator